MRGRYLIAGILIGIVISAAGLGRARGEFRTVPSWWVRQAMCVHHGEGSWRDPNAPYYGGMQMDMTFMRHHGGWMLRHYGTADHWPIRAQLIVAYRGWKSQGWGAWPNTARACGLIG
jgi:hypothetical protein